MKNHFPKFLTFLSENLAEANAYGSEFEQTIADNIQAWIEQNGLSKKFAARRYQTLTEFDGNRDEDYSDVVVEDLQSRKQIFIECKKHIRDNISQVMVDIKDVDGNIEAVAVKGLAREPVDSPVYKAFNSYIGKNEEFLEFVEFLKSNIEIDGIEYCPGDFFFDKIECDNETLKTLIQHYNKIIDDGLISQRNKKFDINLIRETTINLLACGLLWRLSDVNHTWDICHINLNGTGFSKMICTHYLEEKAIPVNYIQIGENLLFRFNEAENPLNIECSVFPKNVIGKFDLKFTPRFGTGSMYITSRSKIAQELVSETSFGEDETQWPNVLA